MFQRYLVATAFAFLFSTFAFSQPALSRGQQSLAISYDDCLRRAQAAFTAEGWVNIGTSGNAVNAFKGIHGSYIVCNPASDGKMAVNIFVASTSNDGNVPGAERVRLQQRMDQGAAPPPPPPPSGLFVRTQKPLYGPNESIVVDYGGFSGSTTDWIALAKPGDADNAYGQWLYTGGGAAGTKTFAPLPVGDYEVRVYFDWDRGGFNIKARYRFSVR